MTTPFPSGEFTGTAVYHRHQRRRADGDRKSGQRAGDHLVQWQDDRGGWHDIEGWQGSLDEVVTGEDGAVVGHKMWWVTHDDLGKGPFRWQICRDKQGAPIGTSETLDLPSQRHVTATVEVTPAQ